ncbi:MAG TPA: DUF4019 domain-containing protein [Thermoanaerobaculia bacterium]|nr:DUF4019 domain-containing protein [Thermoanaerobaculia bacterium]
MLQRLGLAILLTGATVTLLPTAAHAQTAEEAATTAATTWLQSYIDTPRYADAYSWAATDFRVKVEQAAFVDAMERFRRPLGSFISRSLVSRVYKTTLEGAPDGEYVVIEFQTRLSAKAAAKEVITMQKEWWNGRWWPLGYTIE